MKKAWFVSDVHLYLDGADYLEQFLRFLEAARAAELDALFIVGDLFEFWIGDRQAKLGFYDPLFDSLSELVAAGTSVKVTHGNRDFLMGRAFRDAGCELLPDEVVLDLGGRSVHLSHGDQFCIHDRSYLRARKVMRSRPARWLAAALPGRVGHWLARSYRGISEKKKAKKKKTTGNRFHTVQDGIAAEFARGDHDVILCGHIHFPADQTLDMAGRSRRVITTGAWEEGPNYVSWDEGALELREFRA